MTIAKFTGENGHDVWINTEYIVSFEPDNVAEPTYTEIELLNGTRIQVQESMDMTVAKFREARK